MPGALLEAAWVGALDPAAARWVAPLHIEGVRGLGGPSSTEVPH